MTLRTEPSVAALSALAAVALAFATPARAVTSDVSASGFVATFHHELKAAPARVFEAMGHVERWWNPEHSYSGDASHLSMPLEAGGCFCERWDGGSVEHGRVIMVMRERVLRIDGALGPLQGLGAHGLLTFTLKSVEGHTVLDASYRVSGVPSAALDKMAAPVDGVIGEQVQRLVNLVETGRP